MVRRDILLRYRGSFGGTLWTLLNPLLLMATYFFVFGVVLASRETRTLPVAIYNMLSFEQVSWGPLAAAALIVTLPVLILTVAAQRQIVAGLDVLDGCVHAAFSGKADGEV